MEYILMLGLEALCYGAVFAVGVFVIGLIRKYNLQNEIVTLVTAAEMIFGEGAGAAKKEWVLNELVKKFPFLNKEKIDAIIERFVYEVTQ